MHFKYHREFIYLPGRTVILQKVHFFWQKLGNLLRQQAYSDLFNKLSQLYGKMKFTVLVTEFFTGFKKLN